MKRLLIIALAMFFLSACYSENNEEPEVNAELNPNEAVNAIELEQKYVKVTEEYLHNAEQTYDDLISYFKEPESIEVELNSLNLKASELFSNSIDQGRADTDFLLAEDYVRYDKYKSTRVYIQELNEVVADISAKINAASLEYDESFIPEFEAKVITMNRLINDSLDQLAKDKNSVD